MRMIENCHLWGRKKKSQQCTPLCQRWADTELRQVEITVICSMVHWPTYDWRALLATRIHPWPIHLASMQLEKGTFMANHDQPGILAVEQGCSHPGPLLREKGALVPVLAPVICDQPSDRDIPSSRITLCISGMALWFAATWDATFEDWRINRVGPMKSTVEDCCFGLMKA